MAKIVPDQAPSLFPPFLAGTMSDVAAGKAMFSTLLHSPSSFLSPSGSMVPHTAAADAAFGKILESLSHQRIIAHIDVFNCTLLIYDAIINLQVEIEYIWMKKWTFLTVLYVFQRYIPFFDTAGLVLHHQFGANLSTRYCMLNYKIAGWSFIVGVVLSEIILLLRVWAIWKRSFPVAIGLVTFLLACWVPCSIFLGKFLNAMEFAILPFPNFRGCFISGGNHILYVCWVLVMVYDAGTLVMILIPGVDAYRRQGRSEFVKAVYRDGVIYYALIFLVSLINVLVVLVLPEDFVHLLTSFERVLHSLLSSRAILHIRQALSQRSNHQTVSTSSICFARNDEHGDGDLSSFSRTKQIQNTELSLP